MFCSDTTLYHNKLVKQSINRTSSNISFVDETLYSGWQLPKQSVKHPLLLRDEKTIYIHINFFTPEHTTVTYV